MTILRGGESATNFGFMKVAGNQSAQVFTAGGNPTRPYPHCNNLSSKVHIYLYMKSKKRKKFPKHFWVFQPWEVGLMLYQSPRAICKGLLVSGSSSSGGCWWPYAYAAKTKHSHSPIKKHQLNKVYFLVLVLSVWNGLFQVRQTWLICSLMGHFCENHAPR